MRIAIFAAAGAKLLDGTAIVLTGLVRDGAWAAITTGDELTHSTTDGTMVKGRPADRKCAIALQSGAKGTKCLAMVRG